MSPRPPTITRWIAWGAFFGLLFAVYQPALGFGFFSDDLLLSVLARQDPLGLFRGTPELLHYRPLAMSLFWLVQRVAGYDGAIFHFIPISLHLLNTALVHAVLRRLGAPRPLARSATFLFGLFPFAHEAVAFLMGSVHNMALFGMLLATVMALDRRSRPPWWRAAAALLAYLAAVLSHETGIVWPALLLGIRWLRPGRFPALGRLAALSFALGGGYLLLWRTLPRGDPGVLALPIFTLESSLYAAQGWLYPLGPLLAPFWTAVFGPRPVLLRALGPGDWAFLAGTVGLTIGMIRCARPHWAASLGGWMFAIGIAPALIFWGPASGMMNYPRMLVIPGVGSALAWGGVLESLRRRGGPARGLAGAALGATLTVSLLILVDSMGYYRDATAILKRMAQAAREADGRPILFVNLPYNVGYRWFRPRFYPYYYGGAGAVLVVDDRALAWLVRINGGPDLTDRPAGWVRSVRWEALYPRWFTPAPAVDARALREALVDHAVYVFREDLTWIPLHRIWQVRREGTADAQEERIHRLSPPPQFDGRILLWGWRFEEETQTLVLLWEATGAPGRRWQVFVHLLDPGGALIGQADGPMGEGLAPTDAWQAGDRIVDRHRLPSGVHPTAFRVGLYDLSSGERAPVVQAGAPPADSVLLPGPSRP